MLSIVIGLTQAAFADGMESFITKMQWDDEALGN